MKKYLALFFAALAVVLASCTKVEEIDNKENPTILGKSYTISSDSDITTKTSLNGLKVIWSVGDVIKGFDADAEKYETDALTSEDINETEADINFSTVSMEDDLMYLAYPSSCFAAYLPDDAKLLATLPDEQIASANSFGANSNLAVADGLTANPKFKNIGAVVAINIKEDGITSVSLTSSSPLAGNCTINVAGNLPSVTADADAVKTVTLSGTFEKGNTYYMSVLPGTHSGLKLTFHKKGYVATLSNSATLTLNRNSNVLIFDGVVPESKWCDFIDLSCTAGGSSYTDWTKTLSVTYAGKTMKNGEAIQMKDSKNSTGIVVTESSKVVEKIIVDWADITAETRSLDIHASSSPYSSPSDLTSLDVVGTIARNQQEYIFTNAYNYFGIQSTKDAVYLNSITVVWGEGSGLKKTQSLSFDKTEVTVNLGDELSTPVLSGAKTSVSYSSSNTDVATVDATTGELTISSIGTTTITATAEEDSQYVSASASYVLTVQAAQIKTILGIKDVISAGNGSDVNFSATLTNAVVTYVSGKSAFIEDASAGVLYFASSNITNIKKGDSISGDVSGSGKMFNGLCEITSLSLPASLSTATVQETTLTLDQLSDEDTYTRYLSCRVKIQNVATSSEAVDGKTTKKIGEFAAYTYNGVTLYNGTARELICYPGYYNGNQLTVYEAPVYGVEAIELSKSSTSIGIGEKETLSVTFTPTFATNQNISWSTNNSGIVKVSENGEIEGVAAGNAIVTATSADGAKTATCNVTVRSVALEGISLNKETMSINVGASETLTVTYNPSNATNKNVTWTSSDPSKATVSSSGSVTGVAAGSTTITATSADGGYTASCLVTVNKATEPTTTPKTVTFNFVEDATYSKWSSSYAERTIEYDDVKVVFASANKQSSTSTINDRPVTKGGAVEVIMTDGETINSVTFTCLQWASKTQTITLNTSKDGGDSYTATSTKSSNFVLSASNIDTGVNALKFTFSSSSNQVGITSVQINYNNKDN